MYSCGSPHIPVSCYLQLEFIPPNGVGPPNLFYFVNWEQLLLRITSKIYSYSLFLMPWLHLFIYFSLSSKWDPPPIYVSDSFGIFRYILALRMFFFSVQIDCDKTIMVTFKHADKFQEGSECAFQVLVKSSLYHVCH